MPSGVQIRTLVGALLVVVLLTTQLLSERTVSRAYLQTLASQEHSLTPTNYSADGSTNLSPSSHIDQQRRISSRSFVLQNATLMSSLLPGASSTKHSNASIVDNEIQVKLTTTNPQSSILANNETTTTIPSYSNQTLDCDDIQTVRWQTGKKLSNADVNFEDDDNTFLLNPNLVSAVSDLGAQTICLKEGRFRQSDLGNHSEHSSSQQQALVDDWEFKLMYLALHELNHAPARPEYQARKRCSKSSPATIQQNSTQAYEFECRDAKYLVTSMQVVGAGASIRLGAVAHVLMAIASDRIPLFYSNTPKQGARWLGTPWHLASCERKDYQCVFLPTSPCTLLYEDIKNATVIDEGIAKRLRRGGQLSEEYQDARVIVTESRSSPAKFDKFDGIHNVVRKKIYAMAMELVNRWRIATEEDTSPERQHKLEILIQAAQQIQRRDEPEEFDHYYYGHRYYRIPHAILLYLLRPNPAAREAMAKQLEHAIPSDFFSTSSTSGGSGISTIGLPIRGKKGFRLYETSSWPAKISHCSPLLSFRV